MPDSTRPKTPDDTIGARDLTSWHTRFGQWLVGVFAGMARASRPAARRVVSWSSAHVAFVVFAVVALVVMAALVEGVETVYEGVVGRDGLTAVDQPVLDWAVSLRSPGLDSAVTAFTNVGGPVGMPILALVAVAVITWRRRRWTPLVLTLIAAAGSLAMTIVGKDLVDRARPPAALAVQPGDHARHSLRRVHGTLPGLPRPPLAHRRARRLAHRARLGAGGHHRAPPLAHPARTTRDGGLARRHTPGGLSLLGSIG